MEKQCMEETSDLVVVAAVVVVIRWIGAAAQVPACRRLLGLGPV